MATRAKSEDPILDRLVAIHGTLQDLLILGGARAGISKADIRKIAGVAAARVTRIWKHLRTTTVLAELTRHLANPHSHNPSHHFPSVGVVFGSSSFIFLRMSASSQPVKSASVLASRSCRSSSDLK